VVDLQGAIQYCTISTSGALSICARAQLIQ
jgi:hypothetical protein